MKKEEFLQNLRRALAGNVPPQKIEENIRYYDSYISEQMGRGISEEDVIAEIGDPRLIAKTITDTSEEMAGTDYKESEEGRREYREGQTGQSSFGGSSSSTGLHGWFWKILLMLVVVGFFWLLITVIGGIFAILSPLIMPLLFIMIIIWIVKAFTRR